ncbi:MAG: NAD-dependent epimerase/dehydratase family protein [Alphaproteobacteria bacterium]
MTGPRYLITGGAGFIGRHLAGELLASGAEVRVLDSLLEQVHGRGPVSLSRPLDGVEFIRGDVRDATVVQKALSQVDGVFHLAAEVGVGQSMYQVDRYTSVNDLGTAVLFQQLIERPVKRVVVASSMSIYGEGLYETSDGRPAVSRGRAREGWDPVDDAGNRLRAVPTPETKPPQLASVYALNKYVQERMTLMLCETYYMESCALRLFNVYGPGQALSNPYTGVLAIFASRLLNGQRPMVFEDGHQRRDFVHVKDVAHAFRLAMEKPEANGEVINIGSGRSISITETAEQLAAAMGRTDIRPLITNKSRQGDIRHCFADTSKAARLLDFKAQRGFSESLPELADWVATQEAFDGVDAARAELEVRGLVS